MSNIKDLPRIDAYSCKFENQILEKEGQHQQKYIQFDTIPIEP